MSKGKTKQAKEVSREQNRLNELLMDSLPHPAMLVNQDKVILAANRIARRIGAKVGGYCWRDFGKSDYIPEEDKKYIKDHKKIPPGGTCCTFCLTDKALKSQAPAHNPELRAWGKIWDTYWIPLNKEVYLHYAIDITERKDVEESLRQSEARYRAIFDGAAEGILIADSETRKFKYANPAICKMLGYTAEELQQMSVADVHLKEDLEHVISEFQAQARGEKKLAPAIQCLRKDGTTFYADINTTNIVIDTRKCNAGFFTDITKRKEAEEEQEELMEVLRAVNRELESIISVASHDMNTPMVNIEGFSRELAESCDQILSAMKGQKVPEGLKNQLDQVINRDIPEAIQIISFGVSSMKSLLKGLRDMARLGFSATEMEKLDMNVMLSGIVETMRFQVTEAGAYVKIDKLPSCFGDKVQIEQVFFNLLGNALKYLDPARPGLVRISGRVEKDYSVYCVQDNGIGIKADNLNNIFKMHYRVQPANDASEGLGLAIVRRIVNRHNGKVWAESQIGKGSRFFVSLPSTRR